MYTRTPSLTWVALGALLFAGCVASPGSSDGLTSIPAADPSISQVPAAEGSEGGSPSIQPLSDDEAWTRLIPGDPAAVSYPSMGAIIREADVVVVGEPGGLSRGPDFTDEYGNVIYLASLTLDVERVIKGEVKTRAPGTLTIRTWLGVGPPGDEAFENDFQRIADARPSGKAIFFLANMAAYNERMGGPPDHPTADAYAYQILGGQGFLRDVDGKVMPPRVRPDETAAMAGRWHAKLRGRPFDEIVEQVASESRAS